jgi:CheY-like chemotaxis protein
MLINKPAHHSSLRAALGATSSRRVLRPVISENSFDLRVLLVEDNPVNQRLMQKVLANLGCTWTVAENGKMALEELKRVNYHVVLMDLHMLVMVGETAIAAIHEGQIGESMRDVWIAALTADARPEQKKKVREAGANDYLVKPVRITQLRKMLESYVASVNNKQDKTS